MFGFFKRRKEKAALMTGVWLKWGKAIDARQRRWAASLKTWSDRYSTRQKRIALIIFCLVFGTYAVFVGFEAIRNPSAVIRVERVRVPKSITVPDSSRQNIHHP
jgi:hypothetical protein